MQCTPVPPDVDDRRRVYDSKNEMLNVSHNIGPTLPPELCDMVIDELSTLQNRRGAMRSCCLVCKAWLPRARPYLFRHALVVTEEADRANDGSPGPSLRDFVTFLRSASGIKLRANITTLTIYGVYNAPPGRGISLQSLANTLSLLPGLYTLSLKSARIVGYIDRRHVMPSFKILVFEDFTKVEGPGTFLQLISLSLQLESVDIPPAAKVYGRYDLGPDSEWPLWSPPKCISLRNLTIHNTNALDLFAQEILFKVQQDILTTISLEAAVTEWGMRRDMQSPRELISHATRSLEHLSLTLHSSPDENTAVPYPGLGLIDCTSLATLELDLAFTSVCLQAFVSGLLDELFGRAPEYVSRLRRIVLRPGTPNDLAGVDAALDAHLADDTSVRVRIAWGQMRAGANASPRDRDTFVKMMPRLAARGLLYFHPDRDDDPSLPWDACARIDGEDEDYDERFEDTDGAELGSSAV